MADFMHWLLGDPGEMKTSDLSWEEYQAANSAGAGSFAKQGVDFYDGIAYDVSSRDSLTNAINTAHTWDREDRIRSEGYAREDNAYVRLFEQLKALGVNPALLMSSAGPTVGSAGGYSTSAFKTSNNASTDRTDAANSAKVVGSIIAALALIAAAFA